MIRRHFTTVVVAMVTAAVTAGGPAIAAAFDAMNADKVDGKHAVGAGATAAARAGRLVATNSAGKLPNSIIVKAPDADRLDGISSGGFLRKNAKAANADKLDGVDSSALRFINLDPYGGRFGSGVLLDDGPGHQAGVVMPDTSDINAAYGVTLPPDYRTGTPLKVRLLWNITQTDCTVIFEPLSASVARAGQAHIVGAVDMSGMTGGGATNVGGVANISHQTLFTLVSPDGVTALQPGDSYIFAFYRAVGGDSCTQPVRLQSVSVSY